MLLWQWWKSTFMTNPHIYDLYKFVNQKKKSVKKFISTVAISLRDHLAKWKLATEQIMYDINILVTVYSSNVKLFCSIFFEERVGLDKFTFSVSINLMKFHLHGPNSRGTFFRNQIESTCCGWRRIKKKTPAFSLYQQQDWIDYRSKFRPLISKD